MIRCLLLCLLLTGCMQNVDQHQVKEAIDFCKDNGGLYSIQVHETNEKFVTCKNSKRKKLTVNVSTRGAVND